MPQSIRGFNDLILLVTLFFRKVLPAFEILDWFVNMHKFFGFVLCCFNNSCRVCFLEKYGRFLDGRLLFKMHNDTGWFVVQVAEPEPCFGGLVTLFEKKVLPDAFEYA